MKILATFVRRNPALTGRSLVGGMAAAVVVARAGATPTVTAGSIAPADHDKGPCGQCHVIVFSGRAHDPRPPGAYPTSGPGVVKNSGTALAATARQSTPETERLHLDFGGWPAS
jgi:hypothetical protein